MIHPNRINALSHRIAFKLLSWLDNNFTPAHEGPNRIDWARIIPFIGLHFACLGVFFVGCSVFSFMTALVLYVVRIFAIGGFYHRYFSHKTFQTNRFWQCLFAIIGMTAVQRGPLWWAAHHREHHLSSDQPEDPHSPVQHGFWWSHMGWFLSKKYFHHNPDRIKDFSKFAELRFLDRFDVIVPLALAIGLYALGEYLQAAHPHLGTNGLQLLVWGFCISTVCVLHVTFTINSLLHCIGTRPYKTNDHSRNNFLLALLTFGEGWHNNHHYYPISTRQGFKWWEIDITYYLLLLLEKMRIIKNLKEPSPAILRENRKRGA